MNVKELIAELETEPGEAAVCITDPDDPNELLEITGIEVDTDGTIVLLTEGDEDEEETIETLSTGEDS